MLLLDKNPVLAFCSKPSSHMNVSISSLSHLYKKKLFKVHNAYHTYLFCKFRLQTIIFAQIASSQKVAITTKF